MTQQDMRFGIIRSKTENISEMLTPDCKFCHVCNRPTLSGADKRKRYCSNDKCNALIIEEI